MVQQVIDTTTLQPNGKQGEPIRTAFEKANANFDELYEGLGELGTAAQGDLQKLSTDYFGPEPTITWPGMTWGDQANGLEKRRNAANSAWVTLGPLFDYHYTRGNIIGPVSMGPGLAPAGAVIERITASDHFTQRYASGWQETFVFRTLPAGIAITTGNISGGFRSGQQPIVFPVGFSNTPSLTGSTANTGNAARGFFYGLNSSSGYVVLTTVNSFTTTESIALQIQILGRWD